MAASSAALNGDPQLAVEAHPLVREKTAARERAALDLARTTVRAPVDGVVVNMRLQQGEQIKARLHQLAERFDCIGDIRGPGAMVAMELVKQRDAARPDADLTKRLVAEAGKRGLVLLACGVRGNVIRFLAPLTAPAAIIDEGLLLLEQSLVASLT